MANPLDENLKTGTIGELLVVMRLLQYGVQASFTLKDSGNDLIAAKGLSLRTIQVKTSVNDQWPAPEERKLYDILALVSLQGEDENVALDKSHVYLLSRSEVGVKRSFSSTERLQEFLLSKARVDVCFN